MLRIQICAAVLLFALLPPLASEGAVLVVAEAGGDFVAIQPALDAAQPGDTVRVREGAGPYFEKLVFPRSGNPLDGAIRLEAAPGEAPILDGIGAERGTAMIEIPSRSHVAVVGFEIRNNLDGVGVLVHGAGTNIEIRDNHIHDMLGRDGMGVAVFGTEPEPLEDVIVDGNQITDNEPAQSEALVLNGNVTAFEVTNNFVRDNNNIGIDFIGGERDIQPDPSLVARNGLCRGNTVIRSNANYAGGFAAGIYVDGGRDIVIENNRVIESDLGIEVGAEKKGLITRGIVVRNNVVAENERAGLLVGGFRRGAGRANGNVFRGNTLWHNNTLGDQGQGRFFAGGGIAEILVQLGNDNVFENNLIVAGPHNLFLEDNRLPSNRGLRFENNLYWSGDVAAGGFDDHIGLAAHQTATGLDTSSIAADPRLVDPANGDFHLEAASPAVDGGANASLEPGEMDLDGAARVSGASVDIGADEGTARCGNGVVDPGELCEDNNLVDGDGCDHNCTPTGCGNGVVTAGESCDDGNTVGGDCCGGTCGFELAGAACAPGSVCATAGQCDGAARCEAIYAPLATCALPQGRASASLSLRRGSRSSVSWKWAAGAALPDDRFDRVLQDAEVTLCFYVEDGGEGALVFGAVIPAGGGWSALRRGAKYTDRDGVAAGITQVQLRAGRSPRMRVRAREVELASQSLAFPPTAEVIAQLRVDGACYGATFTDPFQRNDADRFRDRSD